MTRLVGINHIALEVGDIDYVRLHGRRSSCAAGTARGWRSSTWATSSSRCRPDSSRAPTRAAIRALVDDKEECPRSLHDVRRGRAALGSLDFNDPWGNHIQIVDYRDIQFSKTPEVLGGMGLDGLGKSDSALEGELRRKGLAGQ